MFKRTENNDTLRFQNTNYFVAQIIIKADNENEKECDK